MTGINKRKHKTELCNKTEKKTTWKETFGTWQTSKRTACERDGGEDGCML